MARWVHEVPGIARLNVPIPETGSPPRNTCEMWLGSGGKKCCCLSNGVRGSLWPNIAENMGEQLQCYSP